MEPVNQEEEQNFPHIILASASPQRKVLMEQTGLPFSVHSVSVEEKAPGSISPEERACRIAWKKVEALIKEAPEHRNSWVLGADTFLRFEGKDIGKPQDEEAARELLCSLAGKIHRVITGIALYVPSLSRAGSFGNAAQEGEAVDTVSAVTEVEFSHLEEEEIDWYLSTGEWKGAAGGYKIQGRGAFLVSKIIGSYSNVVGLPLQELYGIVRANRYFYRKSSGSGKT